MTSLNVFIKHAYIKCAWVFTPSHYRPLVPFRGVAIPRYLVCVLGHDEREIAIPMWRGTQDENLREILAYLHIELSSDLLSNSDEQILYDIARRINAYSNINAFFGGPIPFTLTISRETDVRLGHRLAINLRPEMPAVSRMLKTVFDVCPEFDLITRTDGSHVGHRKHWPLLLKPGPYVLKGWRQVPRDDGLKISLEVDQNGKVKISRSKGETVDKKILEMPEEEQAKIARAAYVKVLKGWDVTKTDEIPPLGQVLYADVDKSKCGLNRKEVLRYE